LVTIPESAEFCTCSARDRSTAKGVSGKNRKARAGMPVLKFPEG
jgi:hypothetical protein